MATEYLAGPPPVSNLRARIEARRREGYVDQRAQSFTIHGPRPKRPRQLVYFIQHGDGPIKIGIALDPAKRLAQMQTGHFAKLTLLATCKGGLSKERRLHARFAQHRLVGEWFTPAPDILAEIERLNTGANQ